MKFPNIPKFFKRERESTIKPNEELKASLKALKEAQSKVFDMLDDYARARDVDTVAFILDRTQYQNFKHLLELKWWGTSVGELHTGKTFLESLVEKLQGERRAETGAAINEFRLAILKIKAKNKPIKLHRSK